MQKFTTPSYTNT